MVVPKFIEITTPLLNQIKDKKVYQIKSLEGKLAKSLKLSKEDRTKPKKSGKNETLFYNRINWAKFYLKKAGLLEDVKKGHVQITDRGLDVVKNKTKIDLEFLKQYPEFTAHYSKRRSNYDFNGEYNFNTNYKENTSNDRELDNTEENFDYNTWEEKDEDEF